MHRNKIVNILLLSLISFRVTPLQQCLTINREKKPAWERKSVEYQLSLPRDINFKQRRNEIVHLNNSQLIICEGLLNEWKTFYLYPRTYVNQLA